MLHATACYCLPSTALLPRIACNGLPDLCDMKINQVTLPGTHNAGSGFDGPLRACSGVEVGDCLWRNQGMNFKEQLDFGIRYFDIDSCYLSEDCNTDAWGERGVFTCHGTAKWGYAYAGPISKILRQIDEWMDAHPYDVVGINFNSNFQVEYKEEIYMSLLQLLEDKWGPTAARQSSRNLTMSTFYQQNGDWPTLLQAIQSNQRIFVFISNAFSDEPSLLPWVHASPASTWTAVTPSHTNCSVIVDTANSSRCTHRPVLLEVSVYSFGICIADMSQRCHALLYEATLSCYNKRQQSNHTVNVILVDYPEQATSPYTVTETAMWLNKKNIRYFLGREPIIPPATILPPVESDSSSASEVTYTAAALTAAVVIAIVTSCTHNTN